MTDFKSYKKPFAMESLWYARPKNPKFNPFVIPACANPRGSSNRQYPDINGGSFSTGIYEALPSQPPMVVYAGPNGLLNLDSDSYVESETIPHWPPEANGASGSDGHCDIIDVQNMRVHSFHQLRKDANGRFTAAVYAFAPLDKFGFGDAAMYKAGARAAGVPTCAGMIRKHEITDGLDLYEHALACSLDYTALSAKPAYVLPATLSDWDPQTNSGIIPEGALLLLPSTFNLAMFDRWPHIRKIVKTLMVYGARVVDRNERTPIVIYVERNSGWETYIGGTWDTPLANALETMRAALRMVDDAGGFLMPNGKDWAPAKRENLMSARGPWRLEGRTEYASIYDSANQRLRLPATGGKWINSNGMGFKVPELKPVEGKFYKLWVDSDCGALLNLILNYWPVGATAAKRKETGFQSKWKEVFIQWPRASWHELQATKPTGTAGYLAWRLIEIDQAEYQSGANKLAL